MSSELGIDSEAVWQSVVEVVIKTIIWSVHICMYLLNIEYCVEVWTSVCRALSQSMVVLCI